MDRKKILIISLIVVVILGVVIYILFDKPDKEDFKIDGIDLPQNMEVLNDTTVGDLKITNVSLLTRDGMSTFKALLSNDTDDDVEIKIFSVIFYENDIENKIIAFNNVKLASNDDVYIDIETEIDLSKVTSIKYVLE